MKVKLKNKMSEDDSPLLFNYNGRGLFNRTYDGSDYHLFWNKFEIPKKPQIIEIVRFALYRKDQPLMFYDSRDNAEEHNEEYFDGKATIIEVKGKARLK